MQEITTSEYLKDEILLEKTNNTISASTDDFRKFLYWSLFSLYQPSGLYMEIETSVKNIINPLYVRITTKRQLKRFIKYFKDVLIWDEGKINIFYHDEYENEKKLSFSYSKTNDHSDININKKDLTFLLKNIAQLYCNEKIAFVKFFYEFLLGKEADTIFFSEYDSSKTDNFFKKEYKETIDYLFVNIVHIKKNDFNYYFTLHFN